MRLRTSTTKSHLKRKWAYGPDVTCLCPQGAGQAARPPDRSLCSWSGAPTGLCLRPGLGPGAQASPACSRVPCAVRGPEAHTRENQTQPGQHKVLHTLTMTSAQRTGHPSPVWKTRSVGKVIKKTWLPVRSTSRTWELRGSAPAPTPPLRAWNTHGLSLPHTEAARGHRQDRNVVMTIWTGCVTDPHQGLYGLGFWQVRKTTSSCSPQAESAGRSPAS